MLHAVYADRPLYELGLTEGSNMHTAEYKPILEEVERILAEAGLDEEEMRQGAAAGPHNPSGQSRNRR